MRRQSSEEELEFPIAYSIVVHSHFGLVERLIRSIWRPQERFYHQNFNEHNVRISNFAKSFQSIQSAFI